MNKRFAVTLLALFFMAGPSAASAAEQITIHAAGGSGTIKNMGADILVLEGVTVKQGKTTITASGLTYYKQKGLLMLTGNVHFTDGSIQIAANDLNYMRDSKEGTFRGQVLLKRKEEKDKRGKVTKDGMELSADQLAFSVEKRNFTAHGNAVLIHKEFTATAGEMSYDDAHQELRLRQQPTLQHQNERIRAAEIVLAVEADTYHIAKAEIVFTEKNADGGVDTIKAQADGVAGKIKAGASEEVVLDGHVLVYHGKSVIATQHMLYDKKSGAMSCKGDVRLDYEEIKVQADALQYMRLQKEGSFNGHVKLWREEQKDDAGKVTKDAFELTCQELDFATEQKNFNAKGEAVLTHKQFTARAGEIQYNDAGQELRLVSGPTLTHDDQTIKAEEIVIAVAADTFRVSRADISFNVEEQGGSGSAEGQPTTGESKPPGP